MKGQEGLMGEEEGRQVQRVRIVEEEYHLNQGGVWVVEVVEVVEVVH